MLQHDHRRCRVPACCNATFVDVHHITPRAEGGTGDIANLIVLCAPPDGSHYGEPVSPMLIDVHQGLQGAVWNRLREAQKRRVLDAVRREPGSGQAMAEGLLREAVARLTARR